MDDVNFCKRVFIKVETGRSLASSAKCVVSDEMGDNKLLKLSCINDNEEMIRGSSEKAAAFCPRRGTLDYHSPSSLESVEDGGRWGGGGQRWISVRLSRELARERSQTLILVEIHTSL